MLLMSKLISPYLNLSLNKEKGKAGMSGAGRVGGRQEVEENFFCDRYSHERERERNVRIIFLEHAYEISSGAGFKEREREFRYRTR